MKYIEYREKREHGTKEFPCACYHVSEIHPRYNMIHHWHNECELILIRQGSFALTVDGREHILSEGDCALVVGGSMHGGNPDNCVYDCLVFDMTTLLKCSQSCALAMQPVLNHEKRLNPVFKKGSEPAQQAADVMPFHVPVALFKHQQLAMADVPDAEQRRKQLGDDRCQRRAFHAGVEHQNKQKIQRHVQK